MAISQKDLERFTRFAVEKLDNDETTSIFQLAQEWDAREQADDLASIKRGIAEADAGQLRPLEQVDRDIRKDFGIPETK